MSDFITPDLINIEDVAEGIYAGSGSTSSPAVPTPIPTADPSGSVTPAPTTAPGGGTTPTQCWVNWQCRWTGHNNGGHSVCHVSANHCGDHSGESLTMHFVTNFPIVEVKNASGCIISNVGAYSFTIIRNNHFNAGDSIGFNFEIVTSATLYDASGNPLHGAIGANNADAYYCKVASHSCN